MLYRLSWSPPTLYAGTLWDDHYAALLNLVFAVPGWPNLPVRYVDPDGRKLGKWQYNLRTAYRKGRLGQPHIGALEALTGWEWNRQEAEWNDALQALKDLKGTRSDWPNLPYKFVDGDGRKLGVWIGMQRKLRKQGVLHASRERALARLKGWKWKMPAGAAAVKFRAALPPPAFEARP
ncbi:MAG TPA: helicase associated domain-containing protein [Alphaproteobacteria bacterium]|nr:helicase associated domain-containing protein [Alphaproteobacteria bacterium]